MNSYAILIYILKSIFISGVFTGYYWIALRNKNFNYYNRFYLLLSITCSLIIPLFNFTWFTIEKEEIPVSTEKISSLSFQINENTASAFPWLSILNYVVIGISIALIAMFMLNIFRVYQLKRRSAVLKMDGIDFIYTDLENAPFSFLKNLFWKESISMESTYGKKIFKHELTHIHQKHTLDILFCQVVNAIFWMNPFNWLIQKELKAIHEFIADKEAIGNNDVEDFARLLLQAHYGNHFLNPTHSFYYSSIKRRLLMLSTTHRTKFSYLRRLLVLPVSAMAITALSVSTTETKATPVIAPVVTKAEAPAVTSAVAPVVISQQPKSAAQVKQPVKRVIKNDTTPTPGKGTVTNLKLKPADEPKAEISFRADKIIIRSKTDSTKNVQIPDVIYYIDGVLANADDLKKLDPNQIKSIHVWKDEAAVKKFGSGASKGVIEVDTKMVL
jgi:beta-lactamase regulating signal transducer with metallopeptidase domain